MANSLEPGQPFPSFALLNQDGQTARLGDFAGKWLAVFVYPKDDTPGCTIESQGFSVAHDAFEQANARAVGLSADGVNSHKSFCGKFGLRVPLLSDPDGALLALLGVGQTDWQGTLYWNRVTFLVDPRGVLRKIYREVKPRDHEKAVLADILALAAAEQA